MIKIDSISVGDCWAQSYHDDRLRPADGFLHDVGNVVILQHFMFCNPIVYLRMQRSSGATNYTRCGKNHMYESIIPFRPKNSMRARRLLFLQHKINCVKFGVGLWPWRQGFRGAFRGFFMIKSWVLAHVGAKCNFSARICAPGKSPLPMNYILSLVIVMWSWELKTSSERDFCFCCWK